jgi:hypothetical protein
MGGATAARKFRVGLGAWLLLAVDRLLAIAGLDEPALCLERGHVRAGELLGDLRQRRTPGA